MTLAWPKPSRWWRAPRRSARPAAGLSLHAAGLAEAGVPAGLTVDVRGLRLAYGGQPVLQGVDWQLPPGQVVGLLGRNGAGKTTLLEALLGLRDGQAGTVSLFGHPVAALDDATRARIGYVPQQADLFAELGADDLLAYFRSFYPRWNTARVDGLLARWQIPRDIAIGRMSGGQQQRLSIIRALAHEPDLLVLDEPVASLDPLARRDFLRELVGEVLDRGTTVVFSTHILSDLERVAFNVAFLQHGRITLQAPLDQLIDEVLEVSGPDAALAALPAAAVLVRGAGRCLLRGVPEAALPDGVITRRVTLEDLFEALT
ncbi:ABC transporter ATP-binding protein [Pseudorhodoferax sp.]|uniref:ABC transporter ATP-binding protein n=1 Tax=Pseudorhodoferax sp. TaxID=1993553 RepID=UPI002DD62CD1|nr:ABC transporter ATP-binding protein [Pseudorhodoferax sp.]